MAPQQTHFPKAQSSTDAPPDSIWQLGLKDDFASTIAPLGKHTRANLRYALVQARKRDWQYVPQMSAEQFTEAVHTLRTTCTHPFSAENAADRIRYSMALPDFFAAGLRNAQGQWLSCIVAQRSPRSTDIVWQMNSPDKKISISTTIRSFLLKHESEARSPCLRVIGGTSPHLQHQLLPLSGTTIFLFRKGFRYALVRLLQARLLHRTPHTPALPFLQHAGQAASSPACSPERTKSPDLFHSRGSIV